MAASSSSPIPLPQREYDVFLSFSGLDSRKSIISHLHAALKRNGFRTFKDDKNLDKGKNIATELSKAIENSSMSIVVLSKNYVASTWCLRELEKIMECRNNLQHFVLPIFVDIEPSDIRKLKGSIAETLVEYKEKVPKMENWSVILIEVATLAGLASNGYRDEASLVDAIVEEVQSNLNLHIGLNVATHPIGIEPRLQKLLQKLCLESSDDVRIIAIWGVGGLGKTTIAKAAYNRIRNKFECCSFVANVRETWEQSRGDLLALQNQILSDISNNENYKMTNSHEGVEFIKHRAFRRKVLLVLDDVDRVEQLNALAINPSSLYCGSRIIITTRDISSLNSRQSVLSIYELEQLNKDESLQLFNLHAFNEHNPPESFMELSNTVVDYAGGIPLVLEVLGHYLNGKNDQSVWRSTITKLEKIPCDDVQRKLRISFDSLDGKQQKLFLDIACFFVGESKNFIIQVLEDYEIFPEDGFQRLEDLCLLKFDQRFVIVMHDILKQMGREIVRQENVDYPGKRSRLWDYKDALKVLKNCEGTEAVEGLILLHNGKDIKVKAKAFQLMTRLRVLHFDHVLLNVRYKLLFRNSGYKHLFKNLAWLRWNHFDLSVLPSQLYLDNLVALDLSYSSIKQVWRGTKVLSKLKFLNLSYCHNLITTPNFAGLPNLEELFLRDCRRLQKVDKSIEYLNKLLVLDLESCRRLKKLPMEIILEQDWRVLSKLKFLNLKYCLNLTKTPNFSWLPNLERLDLHSCLRLQEVDKSIGQLHKLLFLDLTNCQSLRKLPSEVANLKSLEELTATWPWHEDGVTLRKKNRCSIQLPLNFGMGLRCLTFLDITGCSLTSLSDEIGSAISLSCLFVSDSNFGCLPESICNLTKLTGLTIKNCSLPNLPSELGRLNQLKYLDLSGNNFCSLPESISDLTELRQIDLCNCKRLQSLPQLSGRGRPFTYFRRVKVSECPSLESISLETFQNYGFMVCYNCPKLYEKYSADKIGSSFLNYKGAKPFGIAHSGGVFPNWLQHETTDSCYALKVPPLGVENKHFIRCISYALFSEARDLRQCSGQLHNKTKDKVRGLGFNYSSETLQSFGDQIIFYYISLPVDELDLEEGDEIEISLIYSTAILKNWGTHVSYYTIDDHHQ